MTIPRDFTAAEVMMVWHAVDKARASKWITQMSDEQRTEYLRLKEEQAICGVLSFRGCCVDDSNIQEALRVLLFSLP